VPKVRVLRVQKVPKVLVLRVQKVLKVMVLRVMVPRVLVAIVLAVAVAVLTVQTMPTGYAQAQAPLKTFTPEEIAAMAATMPAGEGRELTVRVCAVCHEPQRAASLRLTREGWEEVIAKMVGLGARATDPELKQITDYLATNFKGEAPKPINLNSATSVELESVAGLLRKEAAAWIAYRNKTGPCTKLEDLKKVPGVPFKKIDERRDRLVCF
jgi:competence ComEA-like helix-hairpin-helix protein